MTYIHVTHTLLDLYFIVALHGTPTPNQFQVPILPIFDFRIPTKKCPNLKNPTRETIDAVAGGADTVLVLHDFHNLLVLVVLVVLVILVVLV